jgi:hypothetical protein
MAQTRLQFSLAALLLTVAAVAVVLALTFQVEQTIAFMSLVLFTFIGSAFSTVALVFGRDGIRAFGIGAAFPLAWALVYLITSGDNAIAMTFGGLLDEYGMMIELDHMRRQVGLAVLLSIPLGHLCVGFRWLIDRPRPPEGQR